jgi:hypothetical protein
MARYRQIQLEPSMSASACDATANPTHWHAQPSSISSEPPLHLPTPASTRAPLAPLTPQPSNLPGEQHDILDACMLDIKALQQASGLEEVIAQVETAAVAEMHRLYGPCDWNKGGKPEWKTLKCTVNKREQIYKQLTTEFGGNKETFFEFFTIGQDLGPTSSWKAKGKRKRSEKTRQLRSSNKIAEAIPHRDKDLAAEKDCHEYLDELGCFSQHQWDMKWEGLNRWEVWRALGKERY